MNENLHFWTCYSVRIINAKKIGKENTKIYYQFLASIFVSYFGKKLFKKNYMCLALLLVGCSNTAATAWEK